MPSNPHKDLHLAIKNIAIPRLDQLRKREVSCIKKKDLAREAFERYPISTKQFLHHIDEHYVSTGWIEADSENYYPLSSGASK